MKLDDVILTADDLLALSAYKRYGMDYYERAMNECKARRYIENELIILEKNSKSPYRCYAEGIEKYGRKDGGDITDDDVDILLIISRGQVNQVKERDASTVTIYWVCDSGD